MIFSRKKLKPKIEIVPQRPAVQGDVLGVIAGSGELPLKVCKYARSAGYRVLAICHIGAVDESIVEVADIVEWVKLGQAGKIVSFLKKHSVKDVTFAGAIGKVSSIRQAGLDAYGVKILAQARSGKDDVLLRECAGELESLGYQVVPVAGFAPDSITQEGGDTLSGSEERDVSVGVSCLRALSSEHVGQTVVVKDGTIAAVEAVEGTDAAIKRGGELVGHGAVVVKCAKLDQDMRFDVPTAGLTTICSMAEVGCSVLALEAGRSLIVNLADVRAEARKLGIKLVGIPPLV